MYLTVPTPTNNKGQQLGRAPVDIFSIRSTYIPTNLGTNMPYYSVHSHICTCMYHRSTAVGILGTLPYCKSLSRPLGGFSGADLFFSPFQLGNLGARFAPVDARWIDTYFGYLPSLACLGTPSLYMGPKYLLGLFSQVDRRPSCVHPEMQDGLRYSRAGSRGSPFSSFLSSELTSNF
jgi:hypothetical protein